MVYAQAEFLNLSGSIKDRMALYLLEDAHQVEAWGCVPDLFVAGVVPVDIELVSYEALLRPFLSRHRWTTPIWSANALGA